MCFGEKGECNTAWEERGGGRGELAARTQTSHTTHAFSRSFCPNAGVQWPKFTGQLSTRAIASSRPPSRHLSTTLLAPPLWRQQQQVRDQNDRELRHQRLLLVNRQPALVPSVDATLSNFDRKRNKRKPANEDVSDCLPKLFELSQ